MKPGTKVKFHLENNKYFGGHIGIVVRCKVMRRPFRIACRSIEKKWTELEVDWFPEINLPKNLEWIHYDDELIEISNEEWKELYKEIKLKLLLM